MTSIIERIKANTFEYLIVTILIGGTAFSIKSWYDLGKDYKNLSKSYSEYIEESKESIVAIKQCLLTVMVKQGIDPESMKDLIAFQDINDIIQVPNSSPSNMIAQDLDGQRNLYNGDKAHWAKKESKKLQKELDYGSSNLIAKIDPLPPKSPIKVEEDDSKEIPQHDPFASLNDTDDGRYVAGRSKPTTPLERLKLSQLRYAGYLGSNEYRLALVEDAYKKGYFIKIGSYIGNSGIVVEINSEMVVVEETERTLTGEEVVTIREIRP